MAPILYSNAACPSCRSVLMAANAMSVDLDIRNLDLSAGEHRSEAFRKMNPQCCVPTLDDDGFYLWESRAIMAYLANKYAPNSPIYPKDPRHRAVVDRMLYFDIGTLYKEEFAYIRPQIFRNQPPDPEKEDTFKKALQLLEGSLEQGAYAAGESPTLADFSILSTLTFAQVIDYKFDSYPKILAWMNKLKSEIPRYSELNDDPLLKFKESLKSKK